MSFLQKYKEYIKDNPEGHWFKRKIYGWGWIPVTWQGWALTLLLLLGILFFAFTVDENSSSKEMVFTFFLPIVLLVMTFIRIAYKKGEKPKWQWGFSKEEK